MSKNDAARSVSIGDSDYPPSLLERLGKTAPLRLYCLGNLQLLSYYHSVGFCGSRKATERGLETAMDCAIQAAERGVIVTSGYAAGVDLQAHYHSLASGGSTVIVLPEGINHFRVRKQLKDVWDWERVCVLSQFEPGHPWQAFRAMARNKVIVGLSRAMIVIEAGETGGTLDAGRASLKAGLPLFVAEYSDMGVDARGNQLLIDAGASPLMRLRSTNRANMQRVWDAIADPNSTLRQPSFI